MPSKYIAAR